MCPFEVQESIVLACRANREPGELSVGTGRRRNFDCEHSTEVDGALCRRCRSVNSRRFVSMCSFKDLRKDESLFCDVCEHCARKGTHQTASNINTDT